MESQSFFEVSNGPQLDNTFKARFLCVKDFLKRCACFPFVLVERGCKTFFRGLGVILAAALMLGTLGSSLTVREFFLKRFISLAKDLAEWILLPFALLGNFFRLFLALFFHPNFYFNSLV
jgi:hypothetical protein